jgi:uncharacterized alpha/beta hydrolase family protein
MKKILIILTVVIVVAVIIAFVIQISDGVNSFEKWKKDNLPSSSFMTN